MQAAATGTCVRYHGQVEPSAARCAVHVEAGADLCCLRCGAFACARCAPSPSILCAECAARIPARAGPHWAEVPRAPGRVRAMVFSVQSIYALLFSLLGLEYFGPRDVPSTLVVLGLAALSLGVGVVRIARLVPTLRGRRALREALRTMREQRYAEAATRLEEVLRGHRLEPSTRALALYLFAANVASTGELERALGILEPLVRSRWRDLGSGKLLRGQGQVVLAVVRALAGDLPGARSARAAARFGLWARWTYSPAYGDAVIAARGDELSDALVHLARAQRFAHRFSIAALHRSVALLEAFVREGLGEGDASVEAALAPARGSPLGAHAGMGARWPQMRDFLARRLPSERPEATHLSGVPTADHL